MPNARQKFSIVMALIMVLFGATAFGKDVHVGKIVSAGNGKLVISDVDDTAEVFVVPDDAKITRNGEEANLSDLAEGDVVTVKAMRKDTTLIALEIAATTGQ